MVISHRVGICRHADKIVVMKEGKELTRGKTSLYISHRFASTRFCDRIVLLENGVIAESGTHEELKSAGGEYARIWREQAKWYRSGYAEKGI